MSALIPPVVHEHAFLTLHYRLAIQDGADIVTTFKEAPATLHMGTGQLAPALEAALMGLPEGARTVQVLAPEQAFGQRNPHLLQRVSLEALRQATGKEAGGVVGDQVQFNSPSGGRFSGVVQAIDEEGAVLDFNHPLAGQTILFETHIIGIL